MRVFVCNDCQDGSNCVWILDAPESVMQHIKRGDLCPAYSAGGDVIEVEWEEDYDL